MKKILLALLFAATTLFSFGQQALWNITYEVSLPMGETQDFIGRTSFRGIGVEGRWFVDNNVTIGAGIHWNTFYEKKDKVTTVIENTTITGTHFNYINAFPFYANAAYYFNEGSYIRPFAGINIGTIYSEERMDVGLYTLTDDPWRFALAPEVGVLIQTYGGLNFNLNVRYNHGFQTNDNKALSYIGINAGFVWIY
ncbi:MAG TPA: outer membrane beta-barrel protein [Bacteroidales bacterium]|nr:outer membrane beta-barrel protein [Bacteroidales bacterium]